MKTIVVLLFLVLSVQGTEPLATGDWSAPVKGLRGRLLYLKDKPYEGTRIALIYLELENVGNNSVALVLWHPASRFQVLDGAGQTVENKTPFVEDYIGTDPSSMTLYLPNDSTLRLPISVAYGFGFKKNGGVALQFPGSDVWYFPPDTQGERFLKGTFSVPELNPTDLERRRVDMGYLPDRVWRGTLDFPKLKIPLESPK